jgi:predicted YcjX-like family ATPase
MPTPTHTTDTERLDWLLRQDRMIVAFDALLTLPESDTPEQFANDVRQAIDQLLLAKEGDGHAA